MKGVMIIKEQRALFGEAMSRRDFLKLSGAGLVGATLLGGCAAGGGQGSSEQGGSDFPNKPIEVIIAYEAGGGTDVGVRILQPYLEKELGQSINIVNQPAGGGWVAWGNVAEAKPDGYTIGFLNTPNFISGYMNPELGIQQDLEDFSYIGNQVTDYGAIAINPDDDRFSNIDELIEYAKENRLTTTSTGVGSDDQFSALIINDKYGTKFDPVQLEGSAPGKASVLGGNIDVLFANVGEVTPLHRDEQLKAVAVMSESDEERSEYLPNVPTMEEAGYPGVASWSSRGVGGPVGIDPEIRDILVTAVKKAIKNEEHIQKLGKQGLQVDYKDPDDYLAMVKLDAKRVKELGPKYIW